MTLRPRAGPKSRKQLSEWNETHGLIPGGKEAVRGQRTASAFEDWSVGSLFSLRHGYSILRAVAFSGRKRPDRQLLRILRSALVYSWETASSITRQAPGSRRSHREQDSGRV